MDPVPPYVTEVDVQRRVQEILSTIASRGAPGAPQSRSRSPARLRRTEEAVRLPPLFGPTPGLPQDSGNLQADYSGNAAMLPSVSRPSRAVVRRRPLPHHAAAAAAAIHQPWPPDAQPAADVAGPVFRLPAPTPPAGIPALPHPVPGARSPLGLQDGRARSTSPWRRPAVVQQQQQPGCVAAVAPPATGCPQGLPEEQGAGVAVGSSQLYASRLYLGQPTLLV